MRLKGKNLYWILLLSAVMTVGVLLATTLPSRGNTVVEIAKKKNVPPLSNVDAFKAAPRIQQPAAEPYGLSYVKGVVADLKVGNGPDDLKFDVDLKEFLGHDFNGAIAAGPSGEVYVNDPYNHRVLVLDASGSVVRSVTMPVPENEWVMDLGVDQAGYIYGLTRNRMIVLDPTGVKVTGQVNLREPSEITIVGDGIVLVGDKTAPAEGDNLRFREFDRQGNVISGQEQHNWDLNVYQNRFQGTSVRLQRAGGTIGNPEYSMEVLRPNVSIDRFQFSLDKAPGETIYDLMPLGFDAAGRYYLLSKIGPEQNDLRAMPTRAMRQAAARTVVTVFDLSTGRVIRSVRLEPDTPFMGSTENRFAVALDGAIYQAQINSPEGFRQAPLGITVLKYSPKP